MARYIDADKLIAHLKDEIEGCKQPFGSRANGKSIAYGTELGLKSAISFVETLATADVVPKSEVEKAKQEVAREIFKNIDGITDLFAKGIITELEMYDKLAELKKKYTKEV